MSNEPESNESFFARYRASNTASEKEWEEFNMRLMEQFCADFWKAGNPADVPDWIMNEIATAFIGSLIEKTSLNNSFPLPWSPADRVFTKAEERSMNIYQEITRELIRSGGKVEGVIREVAEKHGVSYETARLAYYKFKRK